MEEDWKEVMRILGIKGLQPTLPQRKFLRATCPDLLKRHPNKSWWFTNKMRLRDELLFVLKELGPIPDEEIDQQEQCREPIPIPTGAERIS